MRQRCFVAAAWASALLLMLPVRASAQKDAFVDAFIDFHSALFGTYGDEGPAIAAALDRMAAGLDGWERMSRATEAALKARGASPADLALHYADEQQLDAAIEAMNTAIAAEPKRAPLHVFQGLLHEAAGHPREAGAAFNIARQLDPTDPVAAYLVAARVAESGGGDAMMPIVATLMEATGRPASVGSTATFPQFTLIDDLRSGTPVFAPAGYAGGFASIARGRFREGLELFRAAAARDPILIDPVSRTDAVRIGVAALRARRGPEAVAELESAVAAHPSSSEAHRVLGIVYRATGRLAESIDALAAAVRLAPLDERSRVTLGSALLEAGRLDDAERTLLETIRTLPASGSARWGLADVYERRSQGVEAVATLDEATALQVPAGKVHLYWRIAELAHGYRRDQARVIAVLTRRTRLVLNNAGAHRDLGLAYGRAGRDDEALVELLMATLLGREDAEMLGVIGQIHLDAARLEPAEATLRRAVALDPGLAQARYALGIALQQLGRVQESAAQLDAFKKLQTAAFETQRRKFEIDVAMQAADRLAQAGRLADAAAAYETLATSDAPADLFRQLAAVYAKLGRTEDSARARETYERLIREQTKR